LVGNNPVVNFAQQLDRYYGCLVEIFLASGPFYISPDAFDGDAALPDGILHIVTLIERYATVCDCLSIVSVDHAGRM
jgi:hypothetical protein